MKKLLFAATALLTCMTAGAQTWIGGSIGLGLNTYGLKEVKSEFGDNGLSHFNTYQYPWVESEKVLSFMPTIGYVLSENLEVGASANFSHYSNVSGFRGKKYTIIEVAPFIRYTFWDNGVRFERGDVTAFIQAGINFEDALQPYDIPREYGSGTISFKTYERDRKAFGIGVSPGIKYAMTEKISLAATFGWLGWQMTAIKAKDYVENPTTHKEERTSFKKYKTSTFGLDLSSAIAVGVYYSF